MKYIHWIFAASCTEHRLIIFLCGLAVQQKEEKIILLLLFFYIFCQFLNQLSWALFATLFEEEGRTLLCQSDEGKDPERKHDYRKNIGFAVAEI